MHYRSMLFVELPAVQKDDQWEQQVQERMEEVKAQHPGKIAEKVLLTVFSRAASREFWQISRAKERRGVPLN